MCNICLPFFYDHYSFVDIAVWNTTTTVNKNNDISNCFNYAGFYSGSFPLMFIFQKFYKMSAKFSAFSLKLMQKSACITQTYFRQIFTDLFRISQMLMDFGESWVEIAIV